LGGVLAQDLGLVADALDILKGFRLSDDHSPSIERLIPQRDPESMVEWVP
jgi:hypothetical protein